jgi:hypothetical protein
MRKNFQIWPIWKTARGFARAEVHYQQRERAGQVAATRVADLEICVQM